MTLIIPTTRALGPTWFFDLEDMAPVVIHVNLDRMGHFMETDEFYRTLALKSRGILGVSPSSLVVPLLRRQRLQSCRLKSVRAWPSLSYLSPQTLVG
jgi:hypothetical protein